jgi:hypothetical protein
MALLEGTLKNYINPVFIETGCYKGDGIQQALDAGFNRVISLEASPELWQYCYNRFDSYINVEIFNLDSGKYLKDILVKVKERATFWLDAHGCGTVYFEDNGKYNEIKSFEGEQPLINELKAIRDHHIDNHTILIDDWRLFGNKNLVKQILKINSKYKIKFIDGSYKNDILVAEI